MKRVLCSVFDRAVFFTYLSKSFLSHRWYSTWIQCHQVKCKDYRYLVAYCRLPIAGGRAFWGVRLRPLACWDRGFESRRGHGCLSLMSVACCYVVVYESGWSLIQRSTTECGVSECEGVKSPCPTWGCCGMQEIQ